MSPWTLQQPANPCLNPVVSFLKPRYAKSTMFTKFSKFRSNKSSVSQNGNYNPYDQLNSSLSTDESDVLSDTNLPYFASKSSSSDISGSELAHDKFWFPTELNLEGNSSPESFGGSYTNNSEPSIFAEDLDTAFSELLPYEDAEEQFLQEHEDYFEHLSVDNVRKDQYPKLESERLVYLDYATCPLYSRFQVEQHMQFLVEEGAPYLKLISTSDDPSACIGSYVDATWKRILNLFNTTEENYSISFTSGLASSYRLFSDRHQFHKGSVLLVSQDNHESVNYMVRSAIQCGAKIASLPLSNIYLCIHGINMHKLLKNRGWSDPGCGILIYPAQSHFFGMRHSLNWILEAQQNGWKVLLDVSSCLPVVSIDLSLYQPEFVVGSLQHMLGYPSSVGFLMVRRNSHSVSTQKGSNRLKKTEFPESVRDICVLSEDENLSLHTFAALSFGFEHLERIGIVAIQRRVENLVVWLIQTLKSLKHKSNEKPLLQIYGSLNPKSRGSIIAFNVLDSTGSIFPEKLVRTLAERSNIILGSSKFNNPSMAAIVSQKPNTQAGKGFNHGASSHFSAVRVSLGSVSSFGDVYGLVQFLSRFSNEDYTAEVAMGFIENHGPHI